MTKNNIKFDTGIEELNEGLSDFYDFYNSEGSKEFLNKVNKAELTSESVVDTLSWPTLKVIYSLMDRSAFDELIKTTNKDSHEILQKTYDLVKEEFSAFKTSEALTNVVFEKAKKLGEIDEDNTAYKSLNIPSTITSMETYIGHPPEMLPILKFFIDDDDDDRLAEISGDWNDLLYLSAEILKALELHVRNSKELHKLSQLAFTEDFISDFNEYTKEINEVIQQLDEHSKEYQSALVKE